MAEHGTYSCYTVDRCRCPECRRANTEYERRRVRLKAYGRYPWRDPGRSRQHLKSLLADGCSIRSIVRASGVSRSTLQALLHGKRRRSGKTKPLLRVHATTETRLLAVDSWEAAPTGTVSARQSWIQIQEMLDRGIPKAQIATALGKRTPALQLSKHRISPENARSVANLHWALWQREPDFRALCRCPLPPDLAHDLERDNS